MIENASGGSDSEVRRALISLSPELAQRFRDPRVTAGIVLVVAGAIALFAGYWGVSGTVDPGRQLPYIISGGIGGLFLLGCGVACFFSSELADLRLEQRESLTLVRELHAEIAKLNASPMPPSAPEQTNGARPPRTRVKRSAE